MRMSNNLNAMIVRSGLSKKDVGALVGHTPETVSRHISGNIKMSLDHAEDYARVLNCSPYDIMFEAQPMPIVGWCHIDGEGKIDRNVGKKNYGHVYSHTYRPAETGIIHWSMDDEYDGIWGYLKNGLESVLLDPIKNNYVHNDAKGFECYALTSEPYEFGCSGKKTRLAAGILYPEPGGVYTIHNGDRNETLRGQKLVWATPVLSLILRPDLRDLKIILDK